MDSHVHVLFVELPDERANHGQFEYIRIGEARIKFPGGLQVGQTLLLREAASLLDPQLKGDIRLVIRRTGRLPPTIRTDVQLDLPINFNDLSRTPFQLLKIGPETLKIPMPGELVPNMRIRIPDYGQHLNDGIPGDVVLRLVDEDRNRQRSQGLFRNLSLDEFRLNLSVRLPYCFSVGGMWRFKSRRAEIEGTVLR